MPETASQGNSPSPAAPSKYDDDASSFPSGQLSDSEDERVMHGASTSLELAEYDRGVLEKEEEQAKLISKHSPGEGLRGGFHGRNNHDRQFRAGRRERRRKRKATKRRTGGKDDEQGELMYEMEEGAQKEDASSESSGSSTELDKGRFHDVFARRVCHTAQASKAIKLTCAASSPAVSSACRCHRCDRTPLRVPCLRRLQGLS